MRRLLPPLVVTFLVVATLVATVVAHNVDSRRARTEQAEVAQQVQRATASTLDSTVGRLAGTADALGLAPHIGARDFAAASRSTLLDSPARSTAYLTLVKGADRRAFERRHHLTISEPRRHGGRRPAGPHSSYAVVTHVAQLSKTATPGLNLLAEPRRRAALLAARRLGKPHLSAPVFLAQSRRQGLVIAAPVYTPAGPGAGHVRGFITAVFDASSLVQAVTRLARRGTPFLLRAGGETIGRAPHRLSHADTSHVSVAGRTITIVTGRLPATGLSSAVLAALIGGLVTVGVAALMYLYTRRWRFSEQRVAERTAALAESEERFRLLADRSTDWVTRHTPDGVWTYVSPSCRDILGYEPEELVGRSPYEFAHFRDRAGLRFSNDSLPGTAAVKTVAYRFKTKDSRWVWLESRSQAIRDPETGHVTEIQCSTRDITERVQAEKELREQGSFLETLVESAGVGIMACDAYGQLTLVNRAVREIRGMSADAELPADWLDRAVLYSPDGDILERPQMPLVRALGGEDVDGAEIVLVSEDGTAHTVLVNSRQITGDDGECLGAVAAMQDVSARQHAEQVVRESEMRFRALATEAPVGIYETDRRGHVRFVNDRWCEIAGMEADKALGSGWVRTMHPEDRHAARLKWDDAVRDKTSFRGEFRFLRPDGEVVWVWSTAQPLIGEGGEITGYLGTCLDVTELRSTDELRAQWEQTFTHTLRGISVTDPATGLIQSVNPAFAAMHGGVVDDFVGRPLTSVFTRESARQIPPLSAVEGGGHVVYESEHVRLDGTTLPVETEVMAPRGADGKLLYRLAYYMDLTEQRKVEAAKRETEQRFEVAFAEAPIGMAMQTLDGRYLKVNRAMCEITGYPADQLEATTGRSITHPDDLAHNQQAADDLLAGEKDTIRIEKRYLRSDGEAIPVDMQITLIRDESGTPLYFLSQVQDITDRKRFEGQLKHLADHDALTNLLNRRRFEEELTRELASASRYETGGALLALDVDNFKYVNDSLGHSVGDELITHIADLLRGRLRRTDVIARLGGDEFAVILPQVDEAQARAAAEALLQAVREEPAVRVGEKETRITFSIGVAMFDQAAELSAEDLLIEADIAMYDAKEAGRDRMVVYEGGSERQERMEARLTWADRIRDALDHDGFVLHAQAIVGLAPEAQPRYELLVRMKGESGDLIPPGAFLYVAERFDLVQRIDRWVVRSAIALLADEQRHGRDVRLEVNLSAKSVTDEAFPDFIEREVMAAGVDATGLCFEVTETAAIVNVERAKDFARRIAALGCQFALDDFGAGFASFYYLKHLEFDYLKIDGEFVRDLPENRTNQLVVRSLVDIARGLGKQTIAEFVEDDATLAMLRDYGVDFAQGYGIAKPAAVEGVRFDRAPAPA